MKIEKLRFNYEEGIVQSTRISNKEKLNTYEKNRNTEDFIKLIAVIQK